MQHDHLQTHTTDHASAPPALPRCYYTVVDGELSFRMLTPGDRSDMGALPPVRPCPRPVVGVLVTEVDGEEDAAAPQTPVCVGHRDMALDARAAQRERLMDWAVPATAPHAPASLGAPVDSAGPRTAG